MDLHWHSFDLRTGRRSSPVAVQDAGTFGRIIGEATDTSLNVRCWDDTYRGPGWDDAGAFGIVGRAWPNWAGATQPGRTGLVALDGPSEDIVWGGMALRRTSSTTEWVNVSLSTIEHYLDRRFAPDLTFEGQDQARIAAGLIGTQAVDGLTFTIDAPDTGVQRDMSFADADDVTVLEALTVILDLDQGLEFTVDLEWADSDHSRLRYVFRARTRLGSSAYPAVWTLPGCIKDFGYTEDYTKDNGANDDLATTGSGDGRAESDHQVAEDLLAGGWPRFERRFQPGTSDTDSDVLNDYAGADLTNVRDGLVELTVVGDLAKTPRLDSIGDDIAVALVCKRFPPKQDADGILQPTFEDQMRVVGWDVDLAEQTFSPRARESDA